MSSLSSRSPLWRRSGTTSASQSPVSSSLLRSPRSRNRPAYRRQNSLGNESTNTNWLVFAPNNVYRQATPVVHPDTLSSSTVDAPGPTQGRRRTPLHYQENVRMVALDKLRQILPIILKHMATATYQAAVTACALLEDASATVEAATTGTTRYRSSSGSSPPQKAPSPLFQWLRASSMSPSSGHNKTLFSTKNDEWSRWVATPLSLLLVAEVFVGDLASSNKELKGLYERCSESLLETRRILCGTDSSEVVGVVLKALVLWIACRRQFLQVVESLDMENSNSIAEASQALGVILDRLQEQEEWGAAKPLEQSLLQQIRCHISGLETCLAVEQALYVTFLCA